MLRTFQTYGFLFVIGFFVIAFNIAQIVLVWLLDKNVYYAIDYVYLGGNNITSIQFYPSVSGGGMIIMPNIVNCITILILLSYVPKLQHTSCYALHNETIAKIRFVQNALGMITLIPLALMAISINHFLSIFCLTLLAEIINGLTLIFNIDATNLNFMRYFTFVVAVDILFLFICIYAINIKIFYNYLTAVVTAMSLLSPLCISNHIHFCTVNGRRYIYMNFLFSDVFNSIIRGFIYLFLFIYPQL
jgi:hypothetical protein